MHIGELPMKVDGEAKTDFLELPPDEYPRPTSTLKYHLSATLAGNDLLVTGVMQLNMIAECARCLTEFPIRVNLPEVCHLFEGVRGQIVDITEELREDILLDIPHVFHCSEDCKGLCIGCGANLNREECTCSKKSKDHSPAPLEESPWSALDGLSVKGKKKGH